MPGDSAFHDDNQFLAELTELNGLIGRYVLRHLAAGAGRTTPSSPHDEHALGEHLVQVGQAMRTRADQRQVDITHG